MSTYGPADTGAQWFANRYPGARIDPNVVVLHTTESMGWPGYNGGATAPNLTACPLMRAKRLEWRAHFPDEQSSRALRNLSGGVETNTSNALQVELIGTCDPRYRRTWGRFRAGVDYIYWPEAPTWALAEVARFLADAHRRHRVPLEAPTFLAYPASYGDSPVRFTHARWRTFRGVVGHQHVPENSHGDPGDLDVDTVLAMARNLAAGRDPHTPTLEGIDMTPDELRELIRATIRAELADAPVPDPTGAKNAWSHGRLAWATFRATRRINRKLERITERLATIEKE